MTVIQEKQPIPKQYWSCLFLFLFFFPPCLFDASVQNLSSLSKRGNVLAPLTEKYTGLRSSWIQMFNMWHQDPSLSDTPDSAFFKSAYFQKGLSLSPNTVMRYLSATPGFSSANLVTPAERTFLSPLMSSFRGSVNSSVLSRLGSESIEK